MRNTLETRLGIFFALALVAAFIVLEMAGGVDFFRKGTTLHARFEDVQELKVGDPVKMAGVQIGRVDKVGLDGDRVRVTFRADPKATIKTDSVVSIKFTGLMGQNYVAVEFGSPDAPAAAPGSMLESKEQASLTDLMAKLDNVAVNIENVTKSFTGDKIDNLLGPITDFVKQNTPQLTAAIGNMKIVSDRLVEGEGTVGRLIKDDELYVSALSAVTNLEGTTAEIKLTLADARQVFQSAQGTVDSINAGQGTLGKMARDDRLYNETTDAMTNLREILQKINRGQGSVGQLVNDDSLLKNVKLSLQKLDKATEGLEDTGPLSILGTAINSLF
ncbi:MAG: MCE family protein [Verrucomicrobia bacterium]|nr:MCE family protein [Verrucomicrobiota bacterium]